MAVQARSPRNRKRRPVRSEQRRRSGPKPVYFLELTLQNVRCFGRHQSLDLSDGHGRPAQWTVILGNNGLGKTTLLQCLTAFEPVEEFDDQDKLVQYLPKGFARYTQLPWRPVRHGAGRAFLWAKLQPSWHLPHEGKAARVEIAEFSLNEKGWASSSSEFPKSCAGLLCYGYGATRRMGSGALSSVKEPGPSDSLFFEDVPLRNAEEWLIQADYAASKWARETGTTRARRDQIKQLLVRVLPDVTDVRILPPGKGRPASQAEVKTPYGWVAMKDLSLGYRTLTAWMVDLASRLQERYPASTDPLAEPAVVLVDEIDLHLHPTWQRQLIGYLSERFPNTQFIVTAHSPLVVQSAVGANIVVLRREGNEVLIDNETGSIRNWRVDQILTSELFGLKTARPPSMDALLAEQTRLLSKPHLLARDKARLRELETRIGGLPAGETREEIAAIELIKRAAARLKEED